MNTSGWAHPAAHNRLGLCRRWEARRLTKVYTKAMLATILTTLLFLSTFTNTAFSIVVTKVQGNIVNTLIPLFPLDELTPAISLRGQPGALL
jgi:hypothetical protein